MSNALPFIVAEVSCNWIDGQLLDPLAGPISQRFERVINVNAARGYRLRLFELSRTVLDVDPARMERPVKLNETIIAVFERDLVLGDIVRGTYAAMSEGM